MVCGDFPSGKIIAYPSHTITDFGGFRISSYSKASTLMIMVSSGSSLMIAECGLGISATADGVLMVWFASGTLYTFVSNSFNDI